MTQQGGLALVTDVIGVDILVQIPHDNTEVFFGLLTCMEVRDSNASSNWLARAAIVGMFYD